jgi:hypothetical protein
MGVLKIGRAAVALISLLSLSLVMASCRDSEDLGKIEVPDSVNGIVVDKDTGEPLDRVRVILEINERDFVSVIGPEGTTRPKIRQGAGAYTDGKGNFSIDLRKAKADLGVAYPGEQLVMGRLFLSKQGYQYLFETYNGAGQVFRLEKK